MTLFTHILLWTLWTKMNKCQWKLLQASSKISQEVWCELVETPRSLANEFEVCLTYDLWTRLLLFLTRSFDVSWKVCSSIIIFISLWTVCFQCVINYVLIPESCLYEKRNWSNGKRSLNFSVHITRGLFFVNRGRNQWEMTGTDTVLLHEVCEQFCLWYCFCFERKKCFWNQILILWLIR